MAWGRDPFTGQLRVARGVVAVGPIALGAVAVGPVAVGLVALGQVAAGVAFAAGQLAAAVVAVGQVAAGAMLAMGQAAAAARARGMWTFQGTLAFVLLGAVWLAAAAIMAAAWWRHGRGLARLCAPRRPIALAPRGDALVAGKILPLRVLEAPLSRRACVAYDVRRRSTGRPVRVERGGEDFVVDDGTGRARVLAADAVFLLEPQRHVHQAVERRVVATAGAAEQTGIVRAVGTAVERVLLPGDHVTVAGQRFGLLGGGASALCGGAPGPVLVTNRNLDELRAEASIALWLATPLAVSAVLMILAAWW